MEQSEREEALAALYAEVPSAECKGLCVDACGPIDMSVQEARRLRRRGVRIPHADIAMVQLMDTGHYSCPALVDGRCSVYDDRPMICRLYGTVEVMRCPYGCVPKGGFLPHEVGTRLVRESLRVGGGER